MRHQDQAVIKIEMTPLDWTGAGRSRFQNARQFRVFNFFTPALPRALHRYIDILYVF